MAFDGNEGEVVSLQDAATWTGNYRTANPGAIKAHTTGKNKLNSILNQEGCVGIRTYYALDEDGNKCLVMVGVGSNENDLISGVILERLPPCPPYCGDESALCK
jgi:hypothetical protein